MALPRTPRLSVMLNSSKEILEIILLGPTVQPPQVFDNRCRHAHLAGLRLGIGYRGCIDSCFKTISQSLGYEPALDAAVTCLSEAMRYQTLQSQEDSALTLTTASASVSTVLVQYGNALSLLQQAIWDPVRSRSPLTLWAIELLCSFEV